MNTLSRGLGIAFSGTVILLGFILVMWFPIRYSWGRKFKEKLTGMEKLKFSISVGVGLSIMLFAFFLLMGFVLSNPNAAELSFENLRSSLGCIVPMAIIFGSVAALGTYIKFSWLDWLVWRSARPKKEE